MAKLNKWDKRHIANMLKYQKLIDAIYKEAAKEAAAIGASVKNFDKDKIFSFADYPLTKNRVDSLMSALAQNLQVAIVNGIRSEWTLSNEKNNELCNWVFGDKAESLPEAVRKRYYSTNEPARDAFIVRKTNGLNLSDRVWDYTSQFKNEIELGLDIGIREGRSADQMSRDLRGYLQHPDKLFRRVRDEHGNLQLSKAAQAYHPGRGVYRSSYKNARRLAATETNMAYRTADYNRWQQLDFVVGIKIEPSFTNHEDDMCDELAGEYPKDFKWTGWHPHCRCHALTIHKTDEEFEKDIEKLLNNEETDTSSVNEITEMPDSFNTWVADNAERIVDSSKNGTLPYFLKDNADKVNIRTVGIDFNSSNPIEAVKESLNPRFGEVKSKIMDLAKDNPQYFPDGLTDVVAVNMEQPMGIERKWLIDGTPDRKAGVRLLISDNVGTYAKSDYADKQFQWSPSHELINAFDAISKNKPLKFGEEYAMESLWHEIQHSSAKGWSKQIYALRPELVESMEVVHQFCARRSYAGFIERIGGAAVNQERVIADGLGYRVSLRNFNAFLTRHNVDMNDAYTYWSSIIQTTPYEKIDGLFVNYIKDNGKISLNDARAFVATLKVER